MPPSLAIRCGCGALRGSVSGASPQYGNHLVCYCDDCQAFPRFLGCADAVLDANGGSEIYQVSSGRVAFESGLEHLAAVRLSDRGLCRWFAGCCRTPIANTMPSAGMPFCGLLAVALAPDGSLDEAIGPIRMRVNARFALGDLAGIDAHRRAPFAMLFRLGSLLLSARLRGEQRDSPFFDASSGEAVVTPEVLDAKQRRDLEPEAP